MARFDVIRFLEKHNIDYVTAGPRTSRWNVNVKCPLCSSDEFYLGISLRGKGWNCWRNMAHRGASYVRLVQVLIKCDLDTAKEIVGVDQTAMPENVGMSEYVRAKFGMEPVRKKGRLRYLPEFKPINTTGVRVKLYQQYLFSRGYRSAHLDWLFETYQLHYAPTGPFSRRVIIPIFDKYGRLLNWTGRAIQKQAKLRYRALSTEYDKDLPLAVCNPQEAVLGLPYLHRVDNPKVLLVVEGPFDAMWLTFWGHPFGVYATCLFGLNLSIEQMELVGELQDRFDRSYLLLDDDAALRALRLSSPLGLGIKRIPGIKDAAELRPLLAQRFCVTCLS